MYNFTNLNTSVHKQSVSGVFEQFLDKEINIARGIRSLASTSQNHLREFLSTESRRDITFPRILSINDTDFLGGSFARHTKTWPLDDIDVYLPLDGFNLFYLQNGSRLPYIMVSDGVLQSNPILTPRWMYGSFVSSNKVVNEFASVIRRHYPDETEVYPDGQAVSVRMSHGATKSEDGLGYDIVPCFKLIPDNANELEFYLIPDGFDGWLRTNPRLDAAIANKLHTDNNKTYRKIVKLVKYWNKVRLNVTLGSYYIELAIARAFLAKNNSGEFIHTISHGLSIGFGAVNQAAQYGNQTAWLAHSPLVEPGSISAFRYINIMNAATQAEFAWRNELEGRNIEAMEIWGKIFGSSFLTT